MTRILIADDDPAVLTSISTYLEDCGHTILQARDGVEVIEQFHTRQPELLLLDLRMPRLDGLAVVRQIAPQHADLPILMISGAGQIADAVAALKVGAWDYLVKPIKDMAVLQHAIDKALERQKLLRQVRQYQQGLEEQIRQRTAELQAANQALEHKTIALREVIASVQAEKGEAVQAIACRIEHTVLPLLQRLRDEATPACLAILDHVDDNLRQITSWQADPLAHLASHLTPTELRICRLIRQGLSSKEIARAEGISRETVESHRRNIRRKLKINNEQVNLAAYLQSLRELDDPSIHSPDGTR